MPVLGEWKRGCILRMRYVAALIQQPEPIYSLICATVGPVLSLRGGGGFVTEMPVVFNPQRCCIGLSFCQWKTLLMWKPCWQRNQWATAKNVFHTVFGSRVCFCICKNFDHNDIQIMLLNFCKLKVDALGLVPVGTCMVQSVPSQFVNRGKSSGLHAWRAGLHITSYLFSFIWLLLSSHSNFTQFSI